jgi:peroxidase
MASSTSGHCLFLALLLLSGAAYGQLSTSFYATTCPGLESTVRSVVSSAIASDRRMGASLLRLFFHDCFVQVFLFSTDNAVRLETIDRLTGATRGDIN